MAINVLFFFIFNTMRGGVGAKRAQNLNIKVDIEKQNLIEH